MALDAQVRKLTADLDCVRQEWDAALEKAEQKEGEIRQLQQVIESLRRSEDIE